MFRSAPYTRWQRTRQITAIPVWMMLVLIWEHEARGRSHQAEVMRGFLRRELERRDGTAA